MRMGQRITGMTSGQKSLPVVKSMFKFAQHGKCGTWVSELAAAYRRASSTTSASSRSMHTEAINHDPGDHFHPDRVPAARPALRRLVARLRPRAAEPEPARFVVMISSGNESDQPLYPRLWGAGFLPSEYQGVQFRGERRPGPLSVQPAGRRPRPRAGSMLDGLAELNAKQFERFGDPEINTRIAQYEMAFRMQTACRS